ncbi:MAG: 30S ribosome-binding factor RbfA [Bacteroidetes bacterium]|nr:30S ribosome-binding factor RbfA [Bacteroidota bacterium]
MDSTRQLKVARLIQKEVADIFLREGKNYFGSALITVTGVRISPDMSFAKIYLSLYGTKDRNALLTLIKENVPEIRKKLGQRIGKQVRIIPEINFYIDDSMDYAARINELLNK